MFNLGTGKGNSVLEVINQVKEITGVKFGVGKGEVRKGEYGAVYADIGKVKKVLGWNRKKQSKIVWKRWLGGIRESRMGGKVKKKDIIVYERF